MSTVNTSSSVTSVVLPYPAEQFATEYLEQQSINALKEMKKTCKIRATKQSMQDTVADYVRLISEWYLKKTSKPKKTASKKPDSADDITASLSKMKLSVKKKDNFDFGMLNTLLDAYIQYINKICELNTKLTDKLIRKNNFPSEISENIVKFYIKKKVAPYTLPIWNTKAGDLEHEGNKIEVKGFSSHGPLSFGPKEAWTELYFVDCMDFKEKKFKIYRIPLSNMADHFRNVKLSMTNTYGQVADANKRGQLRGAFYDVFHKQLSPLGLSTCVFDGPLSELE
jgi:hypothetical protein